MRRFIATLMLFLFPWAVDQAQVKCICPETTTSSFFGLSYGSTSVVPTVPNKIIRLWDSFSPNAAGWNASSNNCGTPDFTAVNAWLAQAQTNQDDVMWTAGRTPGCAIGGCPASCSGGFAPNGYAQPPSDIDSGDTQWKNFVTALVNNSLAQPRHIKYYECVNEFDSPGMWTGTIAQLKKFCGDMYVIVHSKDPAAQIWGPSASTGNSFGIHGYSGAVPTSGAANGYIAAGGETTYDIMNLHAYIQGCTNMHSTYPFCDTPEGLGGQSGGIREYIQQAKAISTKPIGFSEGSYGCKEGNTIPDAKKAAYLVREYFIMWDEGITNYVWYQWDNSGHSLVTSCGTMANNAVAGTISKAFEITQVWLIGAQAAADRDTDPTKKPCVVTGTKTVCSYVLNGKPTQVLWDTTSTPTVTVPASFTKKYLVDGSNSLIASNQVVLGETPIRVD